MSDLFLTLKLIHILAANLMVGATVINGLIHSMARKAPSSNARAMLSIVGAVNSKIMGPSLLVLPLSGVMLAWAAGYSLQSAWLLLAIALNVLLIIAYIFGARLEHQLYRIAGSASDNGDAALPARYERVFQNAAPIGGAALVMSLAAIILMVFKPF